MGDRIRDFTVMAILENEVVLGRGARTVRLPLARGGSASMAAAAAPPAAVPAAAPIATPAGPPPGGSAPPAVTIEPAPVSTPPPPPTTLVRSADVRPAGSPAQTAVPVAGVPLAPAPPTPPLTPPGATLYTPSGTSVYGFTIAPVTTQNEVTVRGVTSLPVASNEVRPGGQALPPAAVLYTPSDTSVYGVMAPPVTTQSVVTLRGVTGLPVASNQAPSATQVLPRPLYSIEVGPFSDQQSAISAAQRLAQTGFRASVAAGPAGQFTVTLNPPPRATAGDGLLMVRSVGPDLPVRLQLVP